MKTDLLLLSFFFVLIACKTDMKHDDGQLLILELNKVSQAVEQVGKDFSDTSWIYFIEEAKNQAEIRKAESLKNTILESRKSLDKIDIEDNFKELKADISGYFDAAKQYADDAAMMSGEKDITERQLMFHQLERNLDRLRSMPDRIENARQRILQNQSETKR